MEKISPFLWYNNNAADAAAFYTNIFDNSAIMHSSPMLTAFKLAGQNLTALNGGDKFKLNPSISLMVHCTTVAEVDMLWEKLSAGGSIMMELNTYPWSEKYGWCVDQFGLNWQILKHELLDGENKIKPSMLFVGHQYGHAEAAVHFYTSLFTNSKINSLTLYGANASQQEGKLMHSSFVIEDCTLIAMDGLGNHEFEFNEAFSFVINCKDQQEVDYYWNAITTNGGSESQCAWCKDKFGISWQVVPARLMELMSDKDPVKANKVMQAMLQMKKIIIADLEKAYEG
jgi:predicted 3-demethylubiquinone-9 3-methyltransferase (glyoxalase superfamily)